MQANPSLNIRPGVGILGLFPAMNYKPWYALAELVDNAIDSYLVHESALRELEGPNYKLRIVIRVEGDGDGLITVWDNAAGISSENYSRAFITAVPPHESAGLSQFGIGLKSASCWFAKQWRVTTTALGEPVRRRVDFDVPHIIASDNDELAIQASTAKVAEHGTEVRLWDLHKPPQTQTIGKMRKHLASMYRHYIRNGNVLIEFNGRPIEHEEPAVLEAPHFEDPLGETLGWRKDIEFQLASGESVAGFVGIRATGSTKFAGLALFRYGRLIVGSDDDSYRPPEIFGGSNSYAYQRVFGELHLDDFDVSHTKDAFIWGDREAPFLRALRDQIDASDLPILKQAEGYRARKATRDVVAVAKHAVETAAQAVERSLPIVERQIDSPLDAHSLPDGLPENDRTEQRSLELSVRGRPWIIAIEMSNDPAATEWLEITDRPGTQVTRRLGIRLSLSHPFMRRFEGAQAEHLEGLVRLAAGLAMAELTAREAGLREAGTIRRNLNELLYDALSGA